MPDKKNWWGGQIVLPSNQFKFDLHPNFEHIWSSVEFRRDHVLLHDGLGTSVLSGALW
jgi:hypothetical protein